MKIALYQVDAFTDQVFKGNPAAVCPLSSWLPDATLQAIAAENNLSETAFFVAEEEGYRLRWFTPTTEVDLCGHATLATAHVITSELSAGTTEITFQTVSGPLRVTTGEGRYTLDFPARPPKPFEDPALVADSLGVEPVEVYCSSKMVALLPDEAAVLAAEPDLDKVAKLPSDGLIITAPGTDCDFVSRYFGPHCGIPEDPVTGSAHVVLAPYWRNKLDKTTMVARQVSARGGTLWIEDRGERILLSGNAVLYLKGEITI